jgi:hypothetical protein
VGFSVNVKDVASYTMLLDRGVVVADVKLIPELFPTGGKTTVMLARTLGTLLVTIYTRICPIGESPAVYAY